MWIIPQTDHHEVAIEMAKNRRLCWRPMLVRTTIASQKCCWRHAGDHSMFQLVCVAREDPMGMESNSCKQLPIRWELEENQRVPWPVLQKRCIRHYIVQTCVSRCILVSVLQCACTWWDSFRTFGTVTGPPTTPVKIWSQLVIHLSHPQGEIIVASARARR